MGTYRIAIARGFTGELTTTNSEAADGLARELLTAGYDVSVNGRAVCDAFPFGGDRVVIFADSVFANGDDTVTRVFD